MRDENGRTFAMMTEEDCAIVARSRASLRYWQKACRSDASTQQVARLMSYVGIAWRTYVRAYYAPPHLQ